MAAIPTVDLDRAQLLLDNGALMLDVREREEFDAGHVPPARNIPLAELPDHLGDLPRNRTIVCICRSGGRSARATLFLIESGFEVVNVEGGVIAWHLDDRPFVGAHGDPRVG